MTSCAFPKCKNSSRNTRKDKGVTFHRFPKEPSLRQIWNKLVQVERRDHKWRATSNSRVCSAHFSEDSFYETTKGYRKLKSSLAPSLKFPTVNLSLTSNDGASESASQCQTGEAYKQSWHRTNALPPDRPSRKRVAESDSDEDDDDDGSNNDEPSVIEEKHHTSDKESQTGKFRFSSDILIPESANVTLDQELLMDLHELSDKIQNFYPMVVDRQFTLCFKGEDGDKNEYIFTSASDTRRNGERHASLTCNECSANIVGFRYKCVSCSDYDLCSSCEALGTHAHHVMMRIAKPIKFKQARTLLKRWCDAMKAAGVATMDDITGESGGDVTTGGGPKTSAAAQQSMASNSKEASLASRIGGSLKSKIPGKPMIPLPPKKLNRPPIVKSSIVSFKGKTYSKKSSGTEAKKRKPTEERGELTKKKETSFDVRQNVKQERAESGVIDYYSPFTQAEPTVSVAKVKLEDPDPLDTERVVKEEYRMDYPLSLDVGSAWSVGGADGIAPTGVGVPHATDDVHLGGVFETFTHQHSKHETP